MDNEPEKIHIDMAIRNKDGSIYKLKSPNNLVKFQEEIDLKKLKFHNFNWGEVHSSDNISVVKKESDFGKIKIKPEPATEVVDLYPQKNFPEFMEKQEESAEIPHLKVKTMFHCLPAIETNYTHDIYEDSWSRIQYGEKFIFPGVMISNNDLQIEFWTTDPRQQVTEQSVIYPFASEIWDQNTKRYHRVPFTEYRWWKINSIYERDGGYIFYAVPSDIQPDFSD